MSPAGFEPALPGETDLESVALDHSAMVTRVMYLSDHLKRAVALGQINIEFGII